MNIKKVLLTEPGVVVVQMDDGAVWKRTEGTVAWRCNNPGNLKYGPFAQEYGAIDQDYGGHAIFPNLDLGNRAHEHLLFDVSSKYYNLTLIDAVSKYAPESDGNNPWQYQRYITKKTGVEGHRLLRTLTPAEREGMLACMRIFEGFEQGVTEQYPPSAPEADPEQPEQVLEQSEHKELINEATIEAEGAPKPKQARKRRRKQDVVQDPEGSEDIFEDSWNNSHSNTGA